MSFGMKILPYCIMVEKDRKRKTPFVCIKMTGASIGGHELEMHSQLIQHIYASHHSSLRSLYTEQKKIPLEGQRKMHLESREFMRRLL